MPYLRLDAIVKMAPCANTIADIGCDHGRTALKLLESGKARHVICSDISIESLRKARVLAEEKGIGDKVSFREGSGLGVLRKGEADAAVISGMGADLIARILQEGMETSPERLILSCNSKPEVLRGWLCGNGFCIEDEDLVKERGRYYPIILAFRGRSQRLTDTELEIGPVLLEKKTETLKEYIEMRIQNMNRSRDEIAASNPVNAEDLIEEANKKIKSYTEVLNAFYDRCFR